ncbi:MAG: redox-regulated ATPase YchF [Candidatus Cloacimonetes bacterium]|nr:redox-regulated ATPase YchF [Candidatus Cloacimonadota bacterium]
MIKIGLVGLSKSGKTTIFNAVTGSEAETSDYYTGATKPNLATVDVVDERVDYLEGIYKPHKKIFATIEYIDFIGIKHDEVKKEIFSSELLGIIRQVNALGLVIKGFDIPGSHAQPEQDIETLETEFLFSDLTICEKKVESLSKQYHKGGKNPDIEKELALFQKCYECLSENKMLKTFEFSGQEEKILRGFQFLTLKPMFIILNVDEENFGKNNNLIEKLAPTYKVVEIAGKFEMELHQLDDDEAREFMEEYNIKESAVNKLTRISYDTLGLISFFTIGSDEVRAWTLKIGETALDAAGEIHTDLARGFIRAERFTFDDFKECGSEKALKASGKFHLEGKEYKVQDGDILCIRHN